MTDNTESSIIQRRREQNRLAQRKKRDSIKSRLKELEADNLKLRSFWENIVQGVPSVTLGETGAALAGLTDPVSTRPTVMMTPPASCSSYISIDDFMASPRLRDPPLELADDVESNPGGMVPAMDLAPYSGAPRFETRPRQELEKITKDFHRTTVEPLYGSASTDSRAGRGGLEGGLDGSLDGSLDGNLDGSLDGNPDGSLDGKLQCSNVVGQGPGRDFRKSRMDDGRNQALRIAVSNGHASMVQLLVKHGADINAPIGRLSRTPLHEAAAGADAKIVELLLQNGADASMWDAAGMTALQIAVSADNISVAEVLLQPSSCRGGRSSARDGSTPDFDPRRHNDAFSFP